MTVTDSKSKTAGEDSALQSLIAALGTGSTTGTGKVYMGTTWTTPGMTPHGSSSQVAPERKGTDRWMTSDDATADFYRWDNKRQDDFLAKLKVSGLVDSSAGSIEAGKIWSALVTEASNYGAQGKKVSPFDLLSRYVKSTGSSVWEKSADGRFETNKVTGEKRYIGPQFSTTTASRTDFTDPATARAIATSMFQNLMGRNPGKDEIAQFASALAGSEANNPTTDVTTTQYDPTTGDAIASKITSSGGITSDGKAMLASDQVKGKKEYGAVQAATTYQNALDSLVYGAPA
jgi:hypothetical protein